MGVLSAFFLNLVTLKAGQVSLALLTEWSPGLRVRRYLELNNNEILWCISIVLRPLLNGFRHAKDTNHPAGVAGVLLCVFAWQL